MFTIPRNYSPVYDLVSQMLRSKALPASTNKQSEINHAEYTGKIEGYLTGLATLANQERVAAMEPITSQVSEDVMRKKVGWIPGVVSYDIRPWWGDLKDLRDKGSIKNLSDEEFSTVLSESWRDKIVWNEEFSFYYHGVRKWAVMNGVIPPSPEDKEWIVEEYNKIKEELSPYFNLLDSITKAERVE